MATRMQQRRGTASTWTSANPILAAGEIGFEIDTNKFKIGDGTNRWANLTYFSDAAALTNIIDGAPALLDTLNELAAAIGDDPAFFTTVATNLSNHESDTTNVHGIANTADLATKSYADQAEADAISTASADATTKANAAKSGAEATAAAALSAHESDTTNIHGIANTADLATKTYVDTAESDANSYTDQKIGDLINGAPGALDTLNELAAALGDDANYASTITNALALKAPLASPDLTGVPTAPTAALGTNTTQLATTAFVDAAIEALASRNLVLDGGGV